MYTTQMLDMLQSNWRSLEVDLVTFPAPPTPAKGVLYAADSWRSDTLERGMAIFTDKHEHMSALAGQFTERGPAFVLRQSLGNLLSTNGTAAVIPQPIYCATISYANLMESADLTYADDSILEGVRAISRSCHPASHTVAPAAPYLTAWLSIRYAKDGRKLPQDFVFADHLMAERYFPDMDFHGNAKLDCLFQYLTLADCLVNQTDHMFQLQPVLSRNMRTFINKHLVPNSNLAVRYADMYEYISVVDDFNQLTQGA